MVTQQEYILNALKNDKARASEYVSRYRARFCTSLREELDTLARKQAEAETVTQLDDSYALKVYLGSVKAYRKSLEEIHRHMCQP